MIDDAEQDIAWQFLFKRVETLLRKFAYRFSDEAGLHAAIAEVLAAEGIPFEHEWIASPKDRFDFFIANQIVIEVKTKESFSQAIRQVQRYCNHQNVRAVLLVTTLRWGVTASAFQFEGKPISILKLKSQAF